MNRILTEAEQSAIDWDCFTDQQLWGYWAAKESAFKTVSKLQPNISSSPQKYNVCFDHHDYLNALSKRSGIVKTPVKDIYFQIVHYQKWIHCIASTHLISDSAVIHNVHQIDHLFQYHFCHASKNESKYVREVAGHKIAEKLFISPETIIFLKNQGKQPFPEVYIGEHKTNIDISFSHDGRFVSYAFIIN